MGLPKSRRKFGVWRFLRNMCALDFFFSNKNAVSLEDLLTALICLLDENLDLTKVLHEIAMYANMAFRKKYY